MSFSIKAEGTRDECLDQLNDAIHHRLTGDGQIIRGTLLGFMVDAPAAWGDDMPIKYEIGAFGHHDAGAGVPSLSISLMVRPAGELPPAPLDRPPAKPRPRAKPARTLSRGVHFFCHKTVLPQNSNCGMLRPSKPDPP
jgi:hypothetical protein